MTHYIEEAHRLGVAVPVGLEYGGLRNRAKDDEGLCISGCYSCRTFRNTVRAALEAERAQAVLCTLPTDRDLDVEWDAGYSAGFEVGYRQARDEALEALRKLRA
jgi:hypothetical protein